MSVAQHAIRAAKCYRQWGRFMAVAYLKKRNVPRRLLTIALQLEAVKHVDIAVRKEYDSCHFALV